MTELSDDLDALDTATDAAIARVQADLAILKQQLADAKAQAPTPENLQKIKDIEAKINALDPTNPAILR